ncbi:MAG: alkylhydroperoxidase AhpD family core domain-containing protein [Candidatus Nitrotoga sp. LAW]|nr:MAG: alkylhydroperoxidase AhpD family core domain-containing protein [Candidatus Nitrotoga sp. LAW]
MLCQICSVPWPIHPQRSRVCEVHLAHLVLCILGAKLGEKIAVAFADRNRCEYCLAAHTVLGQNVGVSALEMAAAQAVKSDDAQTAAALRFALKLVTNCAQIADADVIELRTVGFNDEQIVEIMAHVALNIFTNYVNLAFNVPIDFPKINLRVAV